MVVVTPYVVEPLPEGTAARAADRPRAAHPRRHPHAGRGRGGGPAAHPGYLQALSGRRRDGNLQMTQNTRTITQERQRAGRRRARLHGHRAARVHGTRRGGHRLRPPRPVRERGADRRRHGGDGGRPQPDAQRPEGAAENPGRRRAGRGGRESPRRRRGQHRGVATSSSAPTTSTTRTFSRRRRQPRTPSTPPAAPPSPTWSRASSATTRRTSTREAIAAYGGNASGQPVCPITIGLCEFTAVPVERQLQRSAAS